MPTNPTQKRVCAPALLGHADEDAADSYLMPKIEDVRAAINRAAVGIDGTNDGTVTQGKA